MAQVVLLRGVNVGGKRFSPKAVEGALADLGTTSLGAAGTFVVRKRVAVTTLQARIAALLPFEADLVVLSEAEVRAAWASGERLRVPASTRRFATALQRAPAREAALPLEAPPVGTWGVRLLAREGRVVLGVRRPVASTGVYPNAVVEAAFGVLATTRDWTTMAKIVALLERA